MKASDEIHYRLRLAEGFCAEARQDKPLQRWRSCIDNSQLCVENAAKAALSLLGPVGRTHNPAILLRAGLGEGRFPPAVESTVARLAECAELLGPDIHVKSDYGDESKQRTPWELFDESDAEQALNLAKEALNLAEDLLGVVGDQ